MEVLTVIQSRMKLIEAHHLKKGKEGILRSPNWTLETTCIKIPKPKQTNRTTFKVQIARSNGHSRLQFL